MTFELQFSDWQSFLMLKQCDNHFQYELLRMRDFEYTKKGYMELNALPILEKSFSFLERLDIKVNSIRDRLEIGLFDTNEKKKELILKTTNISFWDNKQEWFVSNGNLYMNSYNYVWYTKQFSKQTETTFRLKVYNFAPHYLIGEKYEQHGNANNTSISLCLGPEKLWIRKGVYDSTIYFEDIKQKHSKYGILCNVLNEHKIVIGRYITYLLNNIPIYEYPNPFESYFVGFSHWDKMEEISFINTFTYE